jgi:hypothetical protein
MNKVFENSEKVKDFIIDCFSKEVKDQVLPLQNGIVVRCHQALDSPLDQEEAYCRYEEERIH